MEQRLMTQPFIFDSNACSVERSIDGNYQIRWRGYPGAQQVSIYMFDDPAHFYNGSVASGNHLSAPLVTTRCHEVTIANPDTQVRHYFFLQAEQGASITLAERKLQLQGSQNFRDLGGYETLDGRRLKWGKLYRSGRLSTLTKQDIDYFNRLGVSLVCDFRQELERELEPTQLGDEHTPIFTGLPVNLGSSGRFMHNLYSGVIEIYDSSEFMKELNRDFVINQLPQYAQMFRFLLNGDHPVLIHCASGKDRTGFGAALILYVLGVGEDSIIQDYLLTNDYIPVEDEVKRLTNTFTDPAGAAVPETILRPLIEVRPEYLHACFEEIDRRYRSKQHFCAEALNLDTAKLEMLKAHYLE